MLIVVVLTQLYGLVKSHEIEHPSKFLLYVKFKSRENEKTAHRIGGKFSNHAYDKELISRIYK